MPLSQEVGLPKTENTNIKNTNVIEMAIEKLILTRCSHKKNFVFDSVSAVHPVKQMNTSSGLSPSMGVLDSKVRPRPA